MHRHLVAVVILAVTIGPADAHKRRHHHHHVYAHERETPARAEASRSHGTLPPERSSLTTPRAGDLEHGDAPTSDPSSVSAEGPLQVVISLRDQRLMLYRNGQPVDRSRVSTGMRGHPTPTGIFSIIERQRWHESNLYSLAPMPYMQRITWSGIALHAGIVPGHPASHGCIRLPTAFAKQLWSSARLGTRVIVAPTMTEPVEITHPQLAALANGATSEGPSPDQQDAPPSTNAPRAAAPTTAVTGTPGSNGSPAEKTSQAKRISIFLSRKEGRLFVRAGFKPLFDVPVTIREPDMAFGTHVFTAMGTSSNGQMRWSAITMPGVVSDESTKTDQNSSAAGASMLPVSAGPLAAVEALNRIEIPAEAIARVSLSPGDSLIISDQGISSETGKGTDFVVLMPGQAPQSRKAVHKIARRHSYPRSYARGFFGWSFPW